MKVVMQSVRRSVYSHMPRRIVPAQLGWLTGMSTAHVGIQFALAVQQAALTGQSMYLLYCDLSTFFPSIDRAVLRLHELATGVPSQILDIAAAICNRVVEEAVGTPCRYDSAAGLGDFFVNSMGALMGCVVSPDRAKLSVNSVIAAIELLVQGLRLWRSPAGTPEAASSWYVAASPWPSLLECPLINRLQIPSRAASSATWYWRWNANNPRTDRY